MKNFSNKYIFIYSAALVVVVALILSVVAMSLKERQDNNIRNEKMQVLLAAINVNCTRDEAAELYSQYFQQELTVATDGSIVSQFDVATVDAKEPTRAFNIKLKEQQNLEKSGAKGAFPIYVFNKDGRKGYVIPTQGNGLWGAIFSNIALDEAAGEYVTFIDDDDYVSPTFLESLYAKADKETIVLSNVYAFNDGKPEEQRYYRMTESYKQLMPLGRVKFTKARNFFSGPCMKLIPMSFIQGRRFDTRFRNGEDSLFMFLISDCYREVEFSTEDAIFYRRYRDGSAVTKSRTRREIVINEFKLLRTMLSYYIPRFWKYNFEFAMGSFLSTIHGMLERKK